MEHDLVLEGRVVTTAGILETEVGISEGVIVEVGHGLRGSRRIVTGGCLIFPGFIDMHVHLREPGWEWKEDFGTGTLAAAHGGVTTVVDMPNNLVPVTTRATLETKRRLSRAKARVGVEFYGGVAADGVDALEALADGVVGYKIFLSETTGSKSFPEDRLSAAFRAIASTKRPVSLHCEEQSVIDCMRERLAGEVRPDLHCDLRPPEAESESVRKAAVALESAPGLKANVCHASVRGTLQAVREARAQGAMLYCEVALHHLYFSRRAMLSNPFLKMNPPLRSDADRSAMLDGLRAGAVSFLVTDHAPHTEAEKREKGLAGVPGLDDFGHLVSWLIRERGMDPSLIAKVAAHNPANFLGLGNRGDIAERKRADISVLDLRSPEVVKNESVQSRCGWSPYEGEEFPGKVRWTIFGGELLVDDFEVVR